MIQPAVWLNKRVKHWERHRRFSDALVTNSAGAYAAYRLKFLSVRMLLKAALHLAEITLFARYFEEDFIAGVILIRSAALLGVSIWWGVLEQLRQEVRNAVFEGHPHLAVTAIEKWLGLSIFFSVFTSTAGVAVILLNTDETLGFSIYNAYAIAVFIRFGFDVAGRTYHSGIFAISRIYRPLWSILIGDVLDIGLVLVCWPWLGVWSFSVVFLFVGILRFVILIHFVKRSYSRSPLVIRGSRLIHSFTQLQWRQLMGALKHSLANITALIDVGLIMALTITARDGKMMALAAALYVLRPFISAGYSWSRLFYFDFKILQRWQCSFLTERFVRFVQKVAFWFSLAVGALCVLWTWAWGMKGIQSLSFFFVPLLFARSLFGLYQMLGFSFLKYRYLAKLSVTAFIVLAVLIVLVHDPFWLLFGVSVGLLLLVWRLPPPALYSSQPAADSVISLPAWLQRIARPASVFQLGVVEVNTRIVSMKKVLCAMVDRFHGATFVQLSRTRFSWFAAEKILRTDVVSAGGGVLKTVTIQNKVRDAVAALEHLSEYSQISGGQELRCEETIQACANRLCREFRSAFPDGVCLGRRQGTIARSQFLNGDIKELISIMTHVKVRWWRLRYRIADYDVMFFAPAGEPEVAFMVPRNSCREKMDTWGDMLYRQTLLHSLVPRDTDQG